MKERVHRIIPFQRVRTGESGQGGSGGSAFQSLREQKAMPVCRTGDARYSAAVQHTGKGLRQRWPDEIRWKHETLVLLGMGVFFVR